VSPKPDVDNWTALRQALATNLSRKGIADQRVLHAMAKVPRHVFVPEAEQDQAYADRPLPIGHGQTISQPYMVAAMTEALGLSGGESVLEVGTGSGYQAAVLSELAGRVISLERLPELADRARERLAENGFINVTVRVADGTEGAANDGLFDAIVVTAGGDRVPEPLLEQLAEGGRLVIPVGDRQIQTLMRYTKRNGKVTEEALMGCMFVPLIGTHGWQG
jgi:protein-L-isoaspartate(D-aspartate) O-methyltransferase